MASRSHVPVSKDENLVVLRCYVRNPSNWPAVLEEIRGNIHLLPNSAQEIYKEGSNIKWEKVRRRMADQVSKYMYCVIDLNQVQEEELRILTEEVRKIRGEHSEKVTPVKRKEQHEAERDIRKKRKSDERRQEFIPASLCVSDDEDDTRDGDPDDVPGPSTPSTPKPTKPDGRKSAAQLTREANEMYIDFSKNKLPKLSSKMEMCMDKYLSQ